MSYQEISKVDVRLPGKGYSNSHGARPVHLIITMKRWIRISRLATKFSLSLFVLFFLWPTDAQVRSQNAKTYASVYGSGKFRWNYTLHPVKSTTAPRLEESADPCDPTAGLCLGSQGDHRVVGVFFWTRYPCIPCTLILHAVPYTLHPYPTR